MTTFVDSGNEYLLRCLNRFLKEVLLFALVLLPKYGAKAVHNIKVDTIIKLNVHLPIKIISMKLSISGLELNVVISEVKTISTKNIKYLWRVLSRN